MTRRILRTLSLALLVYIVAQASVRSEETVYVMPPIPTEDEKILALKLAYELNGNSMVGRTIDLTKVFPTLEPVAVPVEKVKPTKGDKRK
jgi:hypothetical protein